MMKCLQFFMLSSFVLLMLFIKPAYSNDNNEWSHDDWTVISYGGLNLIKYVAHGDNIYGHEFGFSKTPNTCSNDNLWIRWSSGDPRVKDLKGTEATFQFDVDGTSFQIQVDLVSSSDLIPPRDDIGNATPSSPQIMTFSNFIPNTNFIKLLETGHVVTIDIVGPKELIQYLDVPSDKFSLEGFIATRLKAKDWCDSHTSIIVDSERITSKSVTSKTGLTPKRKAELDAEWNAKSASKYLLKVKETQDKIIALPEEYIQFAVLAAGGQLNTKMAGWGQDEVDAGNMSQQELIYAMSVAMLKLSELAQAAEMFEASSCHFRESTILTAMASGKSVAPANCRQDVYSTELLSGSMSVANDPEFKSLVQGLINQWSTEVIMLSQAIMKIDLR